MKTRAKNFNSIFLYLSHQKICDYIEFEEFLFIMIEMFA